VDAARVGNRTAMTTEPRSTADTPDDDNSDAPVLPAGEDVRPDPDQTDEPPAGAAEPTD
jgi:hypothetical protein